MAIGSVISDTSDRRGSAYRQSGGSPYYYHCF